MVVKKIAVKLFGFSDYVFFGYDQPQNQVWYKPWQTTRQQQNYKYNSRNYRINIKILGQSSAHAANHSVRTRPVEPLRCHA